MRSSFNLSVTKEGSIYLASCPLPGCRAQGETVTEALWRLGEVLEEYVRMAEKAARLPPEETLAKVIRAIEPGELAWKRKVCERTHLSETTVKKCIDVLHVEDCLDLVDPRSPPFYRLTERGEERRKTLMGSSP